MKKKTKSFQCKASSARASWGLSHCKTTLNLLTSGNARIRALDTFHAVPWFFKDLDCRNQNGEKNFCQTELRVAMNEIKRSSSVELFYPFLSRHFRSQLTDTLFRSICSQEKNLIFAIVPICHRLPNFPQIGSQPFMLPNAQPFNSGKQLFRRSPATSPRQLTAADEAFLMASLMEGLEMEHDILNLLNEPRWEK